MTDRLDEIRRLIREATPGPWERAEFGIHIGVDSVTNPQMVIASVRHEEDIALIAAAPELLAWAAGEIERLRRCRDAVVQVASVEEWWSGYATGLCLVGTCNGFRRTDGTWHHAAGCPVLTIDALAKEVTP